MAQTEQAILLRLEDTYAQQIARAKREGFAGEDATQLAVTALLVGIAKELHDLEQFHAARMAFRDAELKELKRRNEWQANRIKQLGG